jgi:hypothetical protein
MITLSNNKLASTLFLVLITFGLTASAFALPPDPDNAALLYYQAFLFQKQPDETMKDMVADLSLGKIPVHEKIAEYVESNRRVIELTTAAVELPMCDWGLKFSEGFSMEIPYLRQAKSLGTLIVADARILASKGDYGSAIDRCITARKFGLHIAEASTFIGYLVGVSIERIANRCIQDVLIPGQFDHETLGWLNGQLTERTGPLLEVYTDAEREVVVSHITMEKVKEVIAVMESIGDIEGNATHSIAKARILAGDAQFFANNRDYFNDYMAAQSAAYYLPYAQAYTTSKDLSEKPGKEFENNTDATLAAVLAPASYKIYNFDVRSKTFSNAIRAAVEICIIMAKTGQLPQTLPAGLPKDMFSGEDFEYELREDGFVLRCRAKDLKEDKIHEYEFKAAK